MKVMVTGITGFVGKHLMRRMLKDRIGIGAVLRKEKDRARLQEQGVQCFIDDGSVSRLAEHMSGAKYDGVIHLASCFIRDHTPADVNELLTSNVLFPARVLEAAAVCGIPWFINTGTFWQHFENKVYSPVNLYAATKQSFEDIARFYIDQKGMDIVTLKLNDTYGPEDVRPKIFNLWKKIAETGATLEMSPGEQLIDVVHIDDVIDAYSRLINILEGDADKKYRGASFAVTSGAPMRLKDLAEVFEKVAQKKLNIAWGKKPYRLNEVMTPWNTGRRVPGWQPRMSLENGIRQMLISEED